VTTCRWALLTLVFWCLPAVTVAETWTVALDGTGDFETIQEAADAASDGDTIAIGPGRYNRAGHGRWTAVVETDKDLVFVGSGIGQTIIGPEDPESAYFMLVGMWVMGCVTVRGITFENCNMTGIMHYDYLIVEDCQFLHHSTSASYERRAILTAGGQDPGGGYARNCRFEHLGNAFSAGSASAPWTVEECRFLDCASGIFAYDGNLDLSDSVFQDCGSGIGIHLGATGTIQRCELFNSRLVFFGPGAVTIQDTFVECHRDEAAVFIRATNSMSISGCVFRNDAGPTITADRIGGVITDNHILTGNGTWSVYCQPAANPGVLLDLSGNWWGTLDAEVVAASIWDCADDASAGHCVVFEPMAGGPVKNEQRSWSGVKELFR